MSRRRGEFEHRTSIFEGAFRAWSHLGGLEPEDLESRSANDLDPLSNPIENDSRLSNSKKKDGDSARNPDGSKRREYPYEALPRSGLAHPYVQAILSPWLGPDADNEAIQLGLTTLRTWWQHRRKGESGSAVAALGTEKMKGVVEGYTRHFFTLAHCLVMNDKEQPPRSLHTKMKELDKMRNKRGKKAANKQREDEKFSTALAGFGGGAELSAGISADLSNSNLSPLERLHAAQQRQLAESGGLHAADSLGLGGGGGGTSALPQPIVDMKGKCVPGKLDLQGVVDTVSSHAAQMTHRGASAGAIPSAVGSSGGAAGGGGQLYGDPNTAPVVLVTPNGDKQIAMTVDGITCAHCVKIVETVLKGTGHKSPIEGLLDAAADRNLLSVLIKIDHVSNAKRIAFEAARNLTMVGYTAKAKEMPTVGMDKGELQRAMETPTKLMAPFLDWNAPCTCPDNGTTFESGCPRRSQINPNLFAAFDARAQEIKDFLTNGGPSKFDASADQQNIKNEPYGNNMNPNNGMDNFGGNMEHPGAPGVMVNMGGYGDMMNGGGGYNNMMNNNNGMGGGMDPFGGGGMGGGGDPPVAVEMPLRMGDGGGRSRDRNPSIISFGGMRGMSFMGQRGMSMAQGGGGEMRFSRAMSGLSAINIDWENMEDFDVNVDHSAHIDNNNNSITEQV